MTGLYGILGLETGDDTLVNTVGQGIVYEAANEYLRMSDEDMMRAYEVFISEETDQYKMRYKLPGGGFMQRRGTQSSTGAVGAYGGWDVALPLEDFADQIAVDDVELAYMTLPELQRHLDTIQIRNINTVRHEVLSVLFNNVARTFIDERKGSLTIQPLANQDGVLYPPVLGATAEAEENHYIETNYLATAISNTNNPYVTLRNEIEEHFGTPQGFGNICAFINPAEVAETEALTDFDDALDNFIQPGDNTDRPTGLPNVPGRVIGRVNGVWVVEWRWIPATYVVGLDLDAEAPLKMRRDPEATGLGRGLQLVSENPSFPLLKSFYRHRFGVGVCNRLNGVVLELNTGGTYTIPTAYQ